LPANCAFRFAPIKPWKYCFSRLLKNARLQRVLILPRVKHGAGLLRRP
jgi:hypothetical protein